MMGPYGKAAGLMLGGVLFACSPSYDPHVPQAASDDPFQEINPVRSVEERHDATTPVELFPAYSTFVRIAKAVIPAVVHIHVVQRIKGGGHLFRLKSGDGFLQRFLERFWGIEPKDSLSRRSVGSGFLIRPSGYILTNYHVVSNAEEITVRLSDDREFGATVVGSDLKADLALLRIRAGEGLPISPLGDSSALEVGEWAIAVGSPFGLERSVTVGVISATGRHGLYGEVRFIQTDASINYGNSGGPLLNIYGEAIGINTAVMSAGHGIGFAVPINRAKQFVAPLVEIQ